VGVEGREHHVGLGRRGKTVQAEKNNSGGREALPEDEFAEVLVGSE
jgi:hypothetical protein